MSEERIAALEADLAGLRGALLRALSLVLRRGQFVPDWRGALRILEDWAARRAPLSTVAAPRK